MSVEQIRHRLSNGFQPFTVHLSDGREFRVPHRDFIALSRNVLVVIDEKEISHTINPLYIVSIGETPHQE